MYLGAVNGGGRDKMMDGGDRSGGKERSCVALFEPMLPNLAKRGLCPKDGNIKHQH